MCTKFYKTLKFLVSVLVYHKAGNQLSANRFKHGALCYRREKPRTNNNKETFWSSRPLEYIIFMDAYTEWFQHYLLGWYTKSIHYKPCVKVSSQIITLVLSCYMRRSALSDMIRVTINSQSAWWLLMARCQFGVKSPATIMLMVVDGLVPIWCQVIS